MEMYSHHLIISRQLIAVGFVSREPFACMWTRKLLHGSLGKRSFDLQFSSDVPWHSGGLHYYGFRVVSFSYHLPFEIETDRM